tara:strand:- start:223 stop:501 length:279 start_codon:yes stop_codon:yes gene_type:complete
MDNIKIKPSEGVDFKEFEVEIKDITWKMRCNLNDLMIEENAKNGTPTFSWWGNIVLQYTELKEEELNKYSTDEIIAIANKIFEVANKKKSMS